MLLYKLPTQGDPQPKHADHYPGCFLVPALSAEAENPHTMRRNITRINPGTSLLVTV